MTTSAVLLAVYVLACHRATRLVTTDTITDRLRERVRARAYVTVSGADGAHTVVTRSQLLAWLHDLITCDWCTSIYLGAGGYAAYVNCRTWATYVAAALALSSGAGIISDRVG